MKTFVLLCGITSSLVFSSAALAAHQRDNDLHHYEDNAKVTHVKPIYSSKRIATPYRDCGHNKHYKRYNNNNYAPAIVGGLAGGIIGNQFGKGSGRTAMTIAGTVVGSALGYQLAYDTDNQHYQKRDKHCKTSKRYHHKQRIDGYLVRYRYQGRSYTTRMDHRPGKYIPITISVSPLGRYY